MDTYRYGRAIALSPPDEDAPAAQLDVPAIEQIYERRGCGQ